MPRPQGELFAGRGCWASVTSFDQLRPLLRNAAFDLLPAAFKGKFPPFGLTPFRDSETLVLMAQIMLQQRFERSVLVVHALVSVLQRFADLQIIGFLKEQGPGRERLTDSQIPFAANAPVKDDARPPEQAAVFVAEDSPANHHLPALAERR